MAGWTGEQCVSARFDRPADDEALAALSWSTTVREVEAPFSKLSNDGLKHLAKLRDLESLDLSGATIDGRALAHLKGLRSLRYLTLDGTGVTDEGLEHLRELPASNTCPWGGTRVTDAGLAKLRDLPQLRSLLLGYTSVTPDGVAEFARSHPHIQVGLKVSREDKGRTRRP